MIAVALVCAVIFLAMMALTIAGARRRGQHLPVAVIAGIFFPVAWTVWYLRDEQPYRAPHH